MPTLGKIAIMRRGKKEVLTGKTTWVEIWSLLSSKLDSNSLLYIHHHLYPNLKKKQQHKDRRSDARSLSIMSSGAVDLQDSYLKQLVLFGQEVRPWRLTSGILQSFPSTSCSGMGTRAHLDVRSAAVFIPEAACICFSAVHWNVWKSCDSWGREFAPSGCLNLTRKNFPFLTSPDWAGKPCVCLKLWWSTVSQWLMDLICIPHRSDAHASDAHHMWQVEAAWPVILHIWMGQWHS